MGVHYVPLTRSHPVSTAAIRSHALDIGEETGVKNETRLPSEEQEELEDVGGEIFGLDEWYSSDYPVLARLTEKNKTGNCTEYNFPNCTKIRTISGQAIQGCVDGYALDADGNCHKLDDNLHTEALNSLLAKSRENIISFIGYIFSGHDSENGDYEIDYMDYTDNDSTESIERTIKIPR